MEQQNIQIQFIAGLNDIAPQARKAVETEVRKAIKASSAAEIMGFQTANGEVLRPAASPAYAKALWCFLFNKPYEGGDLESLVNAPIMDAVQRGLGAVLFSEATLAQMIASPNLGGVSSLVGDATLTLTKDEIAWLRRELSGIAGHPISSGIESKVAIVATNSAAAFFQSAAGATLLSLISKATATTAGKVAVAKLLKLAAGKALASAAFKGLVMGFVKKAGVVLVIKAALSGAAAAGLPMHKLKGLPPFALPLALIAAVGAFLVHEIWKMPEHLAEKLPEQIGAKIQEEWSGICGAYVAALADEAMNQIYLEGR